MTRPRLLACLLLSALSAPALAMRCGNDLVYEGMTRYEVRKTCGDPQDISKRNAVVYRRVHPDQVVAVEIEVEEWIYDRGSNQLVRRLVFVDGRLEREEVVSD
jgi:hypothetical protein